MDFRGHYHRNRSKTDVPVLESPVRARINRPSGALPDRKSLYHIARVSGNPGTSALAPAEKAQAGKSPGPVCESLPYNVRLSRPNLAEVPDWG